MNNGICFLEDETVYLDKGTERIALSGVSIDEVFYNFNHPVMGSGLMEKHLGVADRKMFNLLLAHNPEYFINYAKWGADLTLSGHVHGGIVRIGKQEFFPLTEHLFLNMTAIYTCQRVVRK